MFLRVGKPHMQNRSDAALWGEGGEKSCSITKSEYIFTQPNWFPSCSCQRRNSSKSILAHEEILTHWRLDKMADILQTTILTAFSCKAVFVVWFQFNRICSLGCDRQCISWSALAHVKAWCRTGDKTLLKSLMTQFTDAYMRHQTSMS